MDKVYKESLEGIGGADRFTIGQAVRISPFASLMRGELATVLGASIPLTGRICVRGNDGTLGHYAPTMLEAV